MPEIRRLMHGFDFTQGELALNKVGKLSPRQLTQVKGRLKFQGPAHRISLGVFAIMAIGFAAFPFLISGPGTEEAKPMLIGFAAFMWIALGLIAFYQRRNLRDLMHARVSVIEGQVSLRQKEVRSRYSPIGTAFLMQIGGKTYQLETPDQYEALENGATYRFHVVRNARVPLVLAVEPL
jgi:fatty acid desaturase